MVVLRQFAVCLCCVGVLHGIKGVGVHQGRPIEHIGLRTWLGVLHFIDAAELLTCCAEGAEVSLGACQTGLSNLGSHGWT